MNRESFYVHIYSGPVGRMRYHLVVMALLQQNMHIHRNDMNTLLKYRQKTPDSKSFRLIFVSHKSSAPCVELDHERLPKTFLDESQVTDYHRSPNPAIKFISELLLEHCSSCSEVPLMGDSAKVETSSIVTPTLTCLPIANVELPHPRWPKKTQRKDSRRLQLS